MSAQPHDAYSIRLEAIDVSDPQLYQDDTWHPYFERLRREAPVHWCRESRYGPYWSVCKYKDIMQVEVNHQTYSSELGGIAVEDQPKELERPNFIRMDRPSMTSSARWSVRSSHRRTSPRWRRRSASGRSG
jgi:cytochrome P450